MSAQGETNIHYTGVDKGIEVVYRLISKDGRGLLLAEPYLGMKINDSPWIPVQSVLDIVIKRAVMSLEGGAE